MYLDTETVPRGAVGVDKVQQDNASREALRGDRRTSLIGEREVGRASKDVQLGLLLASQACQSGEHREHERAD